MLPCRWAFLLPAFLSLLGSSSGFFGWFLRREPSKKAPSPSHADPVTDLQKLPNAPFEMTTVDEKFLAETSHLNLSPLDSCHLKVVSQLQTSCTDVSEEGLAKLGVALFNCQSSVEGRRTYPCTEEMTLAECTGEMDSDTWNAYHIVSNRARAVCYAARQLHFRRRTEHTVNTLVSTAMNQLEAMKLLKEGQEELRELTAESLEKVVSTQEGLQSQQEQLQNSQKKMETSINGNLEQLAQEKALIASGHQLVAQLIEGITKKMENVTTQLVVQDTELQEGHKVILADLSEVRIRSQEVYSKIESNLAIFMAHQSQTAQYYDVLMGKLHRMNETLGMVLYAMDHMQTSVEHRLGHIQGFIAWAGMNLNAIYTCVLHAGYFLLLALLMTFLQTPGLSRMVLMFLVVINALSELNHGISLGFKSLTILLFGTVIGNGMLVCLAHSLRNMRSQKSILAWSVPAITCTEELSHQGLCSSTPTKTPKTNTLKEDVCKLEDTNSSQGFHLENDSLIKSDFLLDPPTSVWKGLSGIAQKTPGHSTPIVKRRRVNSVLHEDFEKLTTIGVAQRHLGSAFDALSESKAYNSNLSLTSNLSISMSPRQLCQSTTKAGQPCRKKAVPGQMFCHVHASGQVSYASP
ncbi:protein brambleberry-like [Ambystoma mexicanum]|uniref:protein brambleberry-like n=1 Tax=Ambystoma mexicanum TaxID=8296 RepID=UPI0037E9AC2B